MSPSPAVPPASARATRRLCGWDVVRLSSLQASPLGVGTPGVGACLEPQGGACLGASPQVPAGRLWWAWQSSRRLGRVVRWREMFG